MIILAVFTKKIIKITNQCLLFLLTTKYNRDLLAHKIKRVTTVKRTITRGNNILACKKPKNKYIQQHKKDLGK